MRSADHVRAIKREHMARKRAADPEAARAYGRRYYAENRDAVSSKIREYYGRRFFWARATKLRGAGRADFKQLASLWKKQRGRCAITGRRLDRTAHLDHIVAKARGGFDNIENLRWVIPEINLAKRAIDDAAFLRLCQDVVSHFHPCPPLDDFDSLLVDDFEDFL